MIRCEAFDSVGGFDPESYDCTLGLEDGTCQRVIEALREKGILVADQVAMWEGRQNKPDNNALRQRRFRQNHKTPSEDKKEDTDTEEISLRNVTVTLQEGAKRPCRRVPDDFKPDEAFALAELPDLDVAREIQQFRDCEFAKPRKDWPAVWRTWIRNCRTSGRYAKRTRTKADPYARAI